MTAIAAARLGLGLARPHAYVAWARAVGIALLTALLAATVLAALSGYEIVERQQRVVDAQTPLPPDVSDLQKPALSSSSATYTWGGETVHIVWALPPDLGHGV